MTVRGGVMVMVLAMRMREMRVREMQMGMRMVRGSRAPSFWMSGPLAGSMTVE